MIKRYGPWKDRGGWASVMDEEKDGSYVRYEDYAAIASELAEVQAKYDEFWRTSNETAGQRDHHWQRADTAEARNAALEAALQGIAKLGGLTLLGGSGMDSERAYQHGAHNAFGQAAGMAASALQGDTNG